jgi:hypothetical protein
MEVHGRSHHERVEVAPWHEEAGIQSNDRLAGQDRLSASRAGLARGGGVLGVHALSVPRERWAVPRSDPDALGSVRQPSLRERYGTIYDARVIGPSE